MGRLIVIEGLDGSGKNTLAEQLTAAWRAEGRTVATLSFPRYGHSIHADLVRDALYGKLGDLTESVYGPALLFALDRRGAAADMARLRSTHDVLLLDRYIASNAAYGAARLGGPHQPTAFPQWVEQLELERFALPRPDHQLLLDTPPDLARQRARQRSDEDAGRALDTFEADSALQDRTAAMYRRLAADEYLSPWSILQPGGDGNVELSGLSRVLA